MSVLSTLLGRACGTPSLKTRPGREDALGGTTCPECGGRQPQRWCWSLDPGKAQSARPSSAAGSRARTSWGATDAP